MQLAAVNEDSSDCARRAHSLRQYLNCKILHGGTLLQPWPNFSGNYVIPSPQLNEDQNKKKVFTAIWDYIRPEFVGFIRAGWLLIVSSSSAQISMGGRLNLDGGTLNLDEGTQTLNGGTLNLDGGTRTLDGGTRLPYNLSTGLRARLFSTNHYSLLICG